MINIAKLLKGAPKGMKLYSPLLGEVEFAEVMDTDYVPILVMCGLIGERFDKYGRYKGNEYPDAECLLFPSKEVRTWEGWKAPVETKFKVGDWIAYNENKSSITPMQIIKITEDKYIVSGHWSYDFRTLEADWHLWTIADVKDGDVLCTYECGEPKIVFIHKLIRKNGSNIFMYYCFYNIMYPRFDANNEPGCLAPKREDVKHATKEQCDLLFAKMREAGYEWDADKKELRKIQPHYDIANFKPFDKVLVRCSNDEEWMIEFYCKYDTLVHTSPHRDYPFMGIGDSYSQCIPFNDDTKHLLGTTKPCSEEYINW
jgi:hypothetical protein